MDGHRQTGEDANEIVTAMFLNIDKFNEGLDFRTNEDVIETAEKFGVDLSSQIQGVPKLEALISENENVKKFFVGYIKQNLLSFLNEDIDGTADDIREEEEV